MRRIGLLVLATLHILPVGQRVLAADSRGASRDTLALRVDSARHSVILNAGPFDLPVDRGGHSGGGMDDHTIAVPLLEFTWPVDGWLRGAKFRVVDRDGRPLPRALVHHLMVINFGRRAFLYPQAERVIGFGRETGDLRLPASIGIPLSAGMPMALVLAWLNDGPAPVAGVRLEVSIEWTSARIVPRPANVLPISLSVFYPVGRAADFDLPAGPTEWKADFTASLGGRIVIAGGHLHDYGIALELQEVTAGGSRTLLRLGTRLTPEGKLLAIDRILPGVAGKGIKLTAGHCYRLIARYDNPTGKTLLKGAMANLILLFTPDHIEAWPPVPANDAEYRRDRRYLESLGRAKTP